MCRRHRLSEDSARGGKSQRCMEIKHSLRQSLEILEGQESQGAGTQQEESEKRKVRDLAEGERCLLDAIGKILASTVNDT